MGIILKMIQISNKNISKKRKSVNESVENQYWKPIKTRFFGKKFEETKKNFKTRQTTTPKILPRDFSNDSKFFSRNIISSEL